MENLPINGAITDTRSDEDKAKDYNHTDFIGGGIITWVEKEPTKLSQRFQSTSWSCGSQALAKALEFFNKEIPSATPLYRKRKNYPDKGMSIQDIGEIAKKYFTTTEIICPSQNMTEEQMNSAEIPDVLTINNKPTYYFLPVSVNLNMGLIAQALENGHPLIICIASNLKEWTYVPTLSGEPTTFGHFVSCIPSNYTLYKGKKALIIDDSSLPETAKDGQRILTEDFLRERCAGIMALKPSGSSVIELKHHFPVGLTLKKGDRGLEVVALQTILVKEGFLKPNLVTGFYGDLTMQACKELQKHYSDAILVPAGLNSPTGVAGKFTLSFLNNKYK